MDGLGARWGMGAVVMAAVVGAAQVAVAMLHTPLLAHVRGVRCPVRLNSVLAPPARSTAAPLAKGQTGRAEA